MSLADLTDAEVEQRLRSAHQLLQQNRMEEALAAARLLLDEPRSLLVATQIAGAALASLHRPAEALPFARKAMELDPKDPGAVIRLLAVLDSLALYEEVEERSRQALGRGWDAPPLRLLFGRALISLGKLDEAERLLRELVQRAPGFIEAHQGLANLIWSRTGDARAAVAPLDAAIANTPAYPLTVLKAEVLSYAGDRQGAYDTLAAALAKPDADVGLHLAASQMAGPLNADLSARHAEIAHGVMGDQEPALLGLVEARLAQGKAAAAEGFARKLRRIVPDDQHVIAMLATAERLQGKPGWGALFDYDAFVGASQLDTPAGWSDLPTYLNDLATSLIAMHTTTAHPIGQSVRGGTQTTRSLLTSRDPAIRALFKALDGPIRRYVAALGRGDDPVRSRNLGGYAYAGIWSVRLRSGGGRHTDHVHPAGWLSSACYIDVPPAAQGADRAGWIRFGEPGLPTRPTLEAEHFVRPEPGRLVLFPSYMWHGVTPFGGDTPRLTVAFDIVPSETIPEAAR